MGEQVTKYTFDASMSLHIIRLLALASNKEEIISVISSYFEEASFCLLYLDWAQNDVMINLAAQHPDKNSCQQTWFGPKNSLFLEFVSKVVHSPDPILFTTHCEETIDQIRLPDLLAGARTAVIMRLMGKATVVYSESRAYAILCISWPYTYVLEPEIQRFFTEIWETLCATISSCRLRDEALAHVRQLKELDYLKTEFLASLSHEMRTPLNGIIGLLSGILGDGSVLQEDVRTELAMANESAEYLQMITSDILDYAKLEVSSSTDTDTLNIEQFDINELASSVILFVKKSNNKACIDIAYSPSMTPILVYADIFRARQILLNLLVNGVKFTASGHVSLSIRCDSHQVIVCVEDTGIGIDPEHYESIFKPFSQVSRKGARSGVGLGLSISKKLVELMNGRMWVESKIGEGSRFFFSLPLELTNAHLIY